MNDHQNQLSRRKIIKFMVLGATVPLINSLVGQAQAAKASKEAMQYRDKPNGQEKCSNCMQFVPGETAEASGECKVVEGSISPQGWCIAYAKKS
ncbi:high-potential iron-sulfur protein [Nitrosomonas sp. Nm166]|uniref:high-potential iron-sulfur protein n=1 Tax=Nitrosomonas sp. Nm166 TaxID=1881054 RepID=UPI0008E8942C|nr:high-potential iron-sulfur protein [Nitrosomonas sp. Nm166]SFE37177.1 High potential iron-sulfur protein [Nitrosomonas sp. Nm166]